MKLRHRKAHIKIDRAKRTNKTTAFAIEPIKKLIKNKIAINTIVSNLILLAAVIVLGLAVIASVGYTSDSYVTQYGNLTNSNINQIEEQISFEFCAYNKTAKSLSVYFLNSGDINGVNASRIYVNNLSNSSGWSSAFLVTTMEYLHGNSITTSLKVGEEGYVVVSPIALVNGSQYTVKVLTWRGSAFVYNFVA